MQTKEYRTFDKSEWGAIKVTQLANYKGFIFGLDGETLVHGAERRSLGHSPGLQCSMDGQAKVIM